MSINPFMEFLGRLSEVCVLQQNTFRAQTVAEVAMSHVYIQLSVLQLNRLGIASSLRLMWKTSPLLPICLQHLQPEPVHFWVSWWSELIGALPIALFLMTLFPIEVPLRVATLMFVSPRTGWTIRSVSCKSFFNSGISRM